MSLVDGLMTTFAPSSTYFLRCHLPDATVGSPLPLYRLFLPVKSSLGFLSDE